MKDSIDDEGAADDLRLAMFGFPDDRGIGGWTPQVPPANPDGYAWLWTLARTTDGFVTGVPANDATFQTNGWPLFVGSQSRTSGTPVTKWRAITY